MEVIELPIDGVIDLHTFKPSEVKPLIKDYIEACLKKKIYEVKIIHGKGTGTLRKIVHSVVSRLPEIVSFRLASEDSGGWGATIVRLQKLQQDK